MNKFLALACLALIPSVAFGQTALEQLAQASGADVKPLVMQVKGIQQMVARPAIPLQPRDVLASCAAIDAKTFRAYSLDEAAGVLNGCMDQLYASADSHLHYTIQAGVGSFAVRACPQSTTPDRFSCQAFIEVQGLVITVQGTILTGDPVLENLNYSIYKRGGKLLGYSASVDNKAGILK